MRAGMVEFERVCEARKAAAQAVDAAAAALGDAYRKLKAGNALVQMSIPDGLRLPAGWMQRDLRKMISHALHKASDVGQIGDQPLPGAAAPDIRSTYDSGAIPTTAAVIGDECAWLIASLQNQLDRSGPRDEEAA